ncbi:ArnT family glycosyltransferase [Methylacidimicrobium tartarophylax]|uniref:ArnT family glycosyltransferase n=1 Tax=Methylacidimicrobium tartarophylax TaxID=1041768 RepID=UPI001157EF2E|nr:glycosyltransferase family 39 protein [Methylacidimicrobium tartarophylax]
MSESSVSPPDPRPPVLPEPVEPAAGSRLLVFALPLLSLLLSFSGSAALPLIDRDEPRFAEATREMGARGEWSVPFFNGAYRLDKPPLIYWLMGLCFRIFGENEIGARMPSILLTALLCLFLFLMGRSLFSLRAGIVAALSGATSLQFLIHGRLAVADMPMVVSIVLAQWAILRLLEGARPAWSWILWLALALGFLAKGPVAWAVPLVSLLLWRFLLWRSPVPWRRLHALRGSAIAVGIIALWGIPALLSTHGAFWTEGMGEHVLRRGVEAFDGRPHFWGYYLVSSLLSLFPWSAFLGWILVSLRLNYSSRSAFLLSWFFAPFLLFTPYATQLPHYLLPGFPAFFLLLGQAAATARPRRVSLAIFWTLWSVGFLAGSFALLATLVRPWEPPYRALRPALGALGGILLSLCLTALVAKATLFSASAASPRARPSPFFLPIGLGLSVLALASSFQVLGTSVRMVEPALLLRSLWKDLPRETVFVASGYTEPSLVFYSGRRWSMESGEKSPGSFSGTTAPFFCVRLERERTLRDALQWLLSGRMPVQVLPTPSLSSARSNDVGIKTARIEGFDSARFSWVDLEVRVGPQPMESPAKLP